MKIILLIIAMGAMAPAAFAQPHAETLYADGQAAYDRADYNVAVAKWQASYDLSKESALLFNLAQAKRLAGDCVGALATYRRFVATDDADPASEQHKLAEDLVRELEVQCPEQKPAVIGPTKVVEAPALSGSRRSGRPWKIAGLVTGGGGIAAIVVGLGLARHGAAIGDEITLACRVSCDWAALRDKDARGKREVTVGNVLGVGGVAAIAGGAIFYYLGVRQETLTVAPAEGGGGVVSWRGSW